MRLLSVNIGQAGSIAHGKRTLTTAIGKKSVAGSVVITRSNVGDRLLIGVVVLEVTSPRIPCSTLAAQM